jgi:uncharacterized coiled-coil protein SlyX
MTENQEKELFLILGRLVNGVNVLQTDVKDIKVTLAEHSQILAEHSQILAEHSQTLAEHSRQLGENRGLLDHLVSKTDSIAMQVLKNDARLSERLTTVEGAVEDLGGKTH